MKNTAYVLFLCLFTLAHSAGASEASLYAPEPPANSAFVRIIDASIEGNATVALDEFDIKPAHAERVTNYRVENKGDHLLTINGHQTRFSMDAGNYYTMLFSPDNTFTLIKDNNEDTPSKAKIFFYNVTSGEASLSAPAFDAVLFDEIAPKSSNSREINAVTFGLAVSVDGKEIDTLDEIELKRRQSKTIIVMDGADDDYRVLSLDNQIDF